MADSFLLINDTDSLIINTSSDKLIILPEGGIDETPYLGTVKVQMLRSTVKPQHFPENLVIRKLS